MPIDRINVKTLMNLSLCVITNELICILASHWGDVQLTILLILHHDLAVNNNIGFLRCLFLIFVLYTYFLTCKKFTI